MSPTSNGTQNNKRHITYLDNTPNTYSMTSHTMEGIRLIQYAQIIILPIDTAAILPADKIHIDKNTEENAVTQHTRTKMCQTDGTTLINAWVEELNGKKL